MQGKPDPLKIVGRPTPLGLLLEILEDVSILTLVYIFTLRLTLLAG